MNKLPLRILVATLLIIATFFFYYQVASEIDHQDFTNNMVK